MAEAHLDHPGEITWFKDKGPLPVLGPCPHSSCRHDAQSTLAWGPSMERYELVRCVMPRTGAGCGGTCRAWSDGHGRTATAWLHVDVTADVQLHDTPA